MSDHLTGGGERGDFRSLWMGMCHCDPQTHSLCQTLGGGGSSYTLPIQGCATQRGRDFEAPDLEQGIHFRGVF